MQAVKITIEDINVKNAKAVFSAYTNMMMGRLHVLEQAEERVQRCLANKAGCVTLIDGVYQFTHCDKCKCHAPDLYFVQQKDCPNWGDLQNLRSLEEWLAYKETKKTNETNETKETKNNLHTSNTNALYNHKQDTDKGQQRYGGSVSDDSDYEGPQEERDRRTEDILSSFDISSEE